MPRDTQTRTTQTRTLILDAAERLFADRGFDATPTAAIARTAGVPKGLLFYYFPTKADLLRALIGERLDLEPVDTTALITLGDPARALLNVTRRLNELQDETQVRRTIVWREQRTHPEVRERLSGYRRQIQGLVEHVLGASILHPIAARRVRTAAAAWVAIITTPSPTVVDGTDPLATTGRPDAATDAADEALDLPELAELICAGLNAPAA
ncbi:TetR/AcrR family transcriptional regulator [Agromyces sp. NPDC056523]|uniref:TetR/AcrR family transcriptional regulator n=1 Tax=Agromyces sp. NPDC056523 TaxID=3345850 RepID=UPI00366C9128